MKPQLFEIGQKVTPKNGINWAVWTKAQWWHIVMNGKFIQIPGPLFGKIYTVVGHTAVTSGPWKNCWAIKLKDLNNSWVEDCFDPIELTYESLTALLEETKPVEA